MKLTLLDRAISYFSPRRGMEIRQNRASIEAFDSYGAGDGGRSFPGNYDSAQLGADSGTQNLSPATDTEDDQQQYDRRQIVIEARELYRNTSVVKGAVGTMRTAIVPTGWRSGHSDPIVAETLNAFIEEALLPENFDYSQRHHGLTATGLALKGIMTDGDHGWHFTRPEGERSFYVQQVRSHRLGNPNNVHGDRFEFQVRRRRYLHFGGVNIDQGSGRVRSYEIYRRVLNSMGGSGEYKFERAVPPAVFSLMQDPEFSDSYRGVCPWQSAIRQVRDYKKLWELQLAQLKLAASTGGVMQKQTGTTKSTDSHIPIIEGKNSATGKNEKQAIRRINGVTIEVLNPGEEFKQFAQVNPGANFWECVRHLLTNQALSLEIPYSFLFDARELNGGPFRFEVSKASAAFRRYRREFLRQSLDKWLFLKINEGLATGRLPRGLFPAGGYSSYFKGKWCYDKDPTADFGREGKLHLEEAKMCATSLSDVAELLGGHFPDVVKRKGGDVRGILREVREIKAEFPEFELQDILDRMQLLTASGQKRPDNNAKPSKPSKPDDGNNGDDEDE